MFNLGEIKDLKLTDENEIDLGVKEMYRIHTIPLTIFNPSNQPLAIKLNFGPDIDLMDQ